MSTSFAASAATSVTHVLNTLREQEVVLPERVVVQFAPGVMKQVRFDATWKQISLPESIEALVIDGLKYRAAKDAGASIN